MRFITLHERPTSLEENPDLVKDDDRIILNPEHIIALRPTPQFSIRLGPGMHTYVDAINHTYLVRESPEEIFNLIHQ